MRQTGLLLTIIAICAANSAYAGHREKRGPGQCSAILECGVGNEKERFPTRHGWELPGDNENVFDIRSYRLLDYFLHPLKTVKPFETEARYRQFEVFEPVYSLDIEDVPNYELLTDLYSLILEPGHEVRIHFNLFTMAARTAYLYAYPMDDAGTIFFRLLGERRDSLQGHNNTMVKDRHESLLKKFGNLFKKKEDHQYIGVLNMRGVAWIDFNDSYHKIPLTDVDSMHAFGVKRFDGVERHDTGIYRTSGSNQELKIEFGPSSRARILLKNNQLIQGWTLSKTKPEFLVFDAKTLALQKISVKADQIKEIQQGWTPKETMLLRPLIAPALF